MNGIDVTGPQLSVLAAAGLVIIIDALAPSMRKALPVVALAGLVLSVAWSLSWVSRGDYQTAFDGTLALDRFAIFFYFLFAGITAAVILASIDWLESTGRSQAEYYALVLTVCGGLMFLAAARDLITVFIALELSSIPQYILAGWGKDRRSSEAGIKYLLAGAVASSLLLYGMALLYGVSGSTLLVDIAAFVRENGADNRALLVTAMVLVMAGFGFKMAIVPFQMWVPDVYQGAPTPVVGFLSVGSKAAAFAVSIRFFFEGLGADVIRDDWAMIFAVLAAVSMTLGNVMAVVQTDIKRMLGYSSVAQAGTILIGLAAVSAEGDEFRLGATGILFFVASYACTNLGAFMAIVGISQRIKSDAIADYRGLAKRAPFLALVLAFCLVSLTGIPPTAGFFAKLFLFNAAARADLGWLVIVGVLNGIVSAYYYLRVAGYMYFGDPSEESKFTAAAPLRVALGFAAFGVLALFVVPGWLFSAAQDAAEVLVVR